MNEAADRPHLTSVEGGDLTEDEIARRERITGQLEGLKAEFEAKYGETPVDLDDLAPVQLAASMWMAKFAQLGPHLAGLGNEFEGEVKLVAAIKWNAKTKKFEALVRCEEPVIRTAKREPAYAAMESGSDQGKAQLLLFNA